MHLPHVWKTMNGFCTFFFLPPLCLSLSSFISLFFPFHRLLLLLQSLSTLPPSRTINRHVAASDFKLPWRCLSEDSSDTELVWDSSVSQWLNTQEHTHTHKRQSCRDILNRSFSKMQKANTERRHLDFCLVWRDVHMHRQLNEQLQTDMWEIDPLQMTSVTILQISRTILLLMWDISQPMLRELTKSSNTTPRSTILSSMTISQFSNKEIFFQHEKVKCWLHVICISE